MGQNFGRIISTMGVTGTSRPCLLPTCGGQMQAWLSKYEGGKFRLMFRCSRCETENVPGVGQARTAESRILNQEHASD